MTAAERVGVFAVSCILLVATTAWAQNRVRVINNRSPIVSSDLVTPITYVDAGAELIRVSEQGIWVEVVLPGLNPRRETGFIARANLVGGAPPGRAPVAPTAAEPPPEPMPVPQQATSAPEPVRRPQAPTARIAPRVSLLGTGLRGFADVGAGSFLAHQSFDAVFGSAPIPGHIRGPWVGGGAQYQFRSGLFIEGEAQFFRQHGERVFVSGDTIFELGIPDTLTILPVSATVGYRFNGKKAAPFLGGGVGQYLVSEKTPFDDSSERAWSHPTSYHVVGGVEFRAGRGFDLAIQGKYLRAPDALTNGIGSAFGESDLGGVQLGIKLLIGR
jgi:hypothetical protein